jgi:mannose-6-phosphate isomerase-like protein (cupin superfamily)
MTDTTIKKIDSSTSPIGPDGQVHLASGIRVAMRLWNREQPNDAKESARRSYETVGYVIEGRAELESEGQTVLLGPGDSWLVPADAEHRYTILETFTAIEATSPPAHLHRD